MTDRIVKVLEQGKFVLRGIQKTGNNPILALDSDETLDVNFDWSYMVRVRHDCECCKRGYRRHHCKRYE